MAPTPEMAAAEMPTTVVAAAAEMRAVTPTVSTAVSTAMTAATLCSGRQRGRQHNDGDTDIES